MTLSIHLVLLIIALVCFGIGAFGLETNRFSLVAAGLFFLTLALIFSER